MTGLQPLLGHEQTRTRLARAQLRGGLAPAILFIGPSGVGKQRTALWLAQMTLCDAPSADGPCGACRHCRMAQRLEHPDINWFFPLQRPKSSGGPEKLGEALEEARAGELESRRSGEWSSVPHDEPVGIYLAHAQVIRRIAGARPAMARRKAIIIGEAEQLVPQEASPEAANALLKLFEEPPPDTMIIATASDPDALLPTVRSRLLPVRFSRLSEDLVVRYVTDRGVDPQEAALIARLAQGSIGRAIGFMSADDGPGRLESMRRKAREILDAALDGSGHAFLLPLSQPPVRARGDFATTLGFVADWLRDIAALDAGSRDSVINMDSMDWLQRAADRFDDGRAITAAIGDVDHLTQLTEFNINPSLALRGVIHRIASRVANEPVRSR